MTSLIKNVYDFHMKYGFSLPEKATPLQPELLVLKIKHLREETEEYADACDRAQRLDALLDVVYVALGACVLEFPLPTIERGWTAIHSANMMKVRTNRPEDSTRNSIFDVTKPRGWTAPNIEKIIHETDLEEYNKQYSLSL